MPDACFDKVFSKYYSGYNLYMHNGANFDMIFFINYLLSRDDLKISRVLYKNSKLLQLDINKEITLKDVFPYTFPNIDNLDYEWVVPAYEFFDTFKVSLEDYNKYCGRFSSWSL